MCVQIKKQLDFHNQDDFEDENKSLDISESESDYLPKNKKSNMKKAQAKIEKIVEKTNKHSKKPVMPILKRNRSLGQQIKGQLISE